MTFKTFLLSAILLLSASAASADTIVTRDGSSINGKILGIDDGKIRIETEFAGEIVVSQSLVESIRTDDPVYVTLEDGATYIGPLEGESDALRVSSQRGEMVTTLDRVQESWLVGTKSPTEVRREAEIERLQRKWTYEAALDFAGKSGNTDSTGIAASFRATLKGAEDQLEFFMRSNFEETDDLKSADDARGGVDYTNYFTPNYNWYVRSEFGRDAIKDIELFFTTAAGFGYTFTTPETRKLNLRIGLGYLYESYHQPEPPLLTREATNTASLDLGLLHQETYTWGMLSNRLTITPTLEDFGNFKLLHDSSLTLPLKTERWSVRTGISNTYDSEANLSGKKKLDTTYYVRMVLRWL